MTDRSSLTSGEPKDDVLELTARDHRNYLALVRFVHDKPLPKRKRLHSERFKGRALKGQLEKQGHTCPDCYREFDLVNFQVSRSVTTEHVIPFRYGGLKSVHNSYLLCQRCNLKRAHLEQKYGLAHTLYFIEDHYGPIDYSKVYDFDVDAADAWWQTHEGSQVSS